MSEGLRASSSAATQLCLADGPTLPGQPAPWIGPLVALGGMTRRYVPKLESEQLVVTISVPRRDFAAVLVGCGWVLAASHPVAEQPERLLRSLAPGDPVRLVTDHYVIADRFVELSGTSPTEVVLEKQSRWTIDRVRAASPSETFSSPEREARPSPPSLGIWAGQESTWDARLAAGEPDLAIVGTRAWLEQDALGCIGVQEGPIETTRLDPIAETLRPIGTGRISTFSQLMAAASLAELLPLPDQVEGVVLDGTLAIKYLSEFEAPVVFCVLDRSVGDETAGEHIVQIRNTRGRPLSLRDEIGWRAPFGIEALAFTVPL